MYALNQWYAAAWDYEVSSKPTARTVCDEDVVLYRNRDGEPAALVDRCWHRMAPLSQGKVLDDGCIQCPYHGLVFAPDGKCTRIPSQDLIPPAARVRHFPVVQKHRFVWIWIGEPEKADEALVPDLHWNDDPQWIGEGGTIDLACDYRLLIDNLMDLTHETYVHTTSIGDELLPQIPIETDSDGQSVTVKRFIYDHQPAPFWQDAIRKALGTEENCDRWQIITYTPPSTIAIDVGVAVAGTGGPQGERSQGVSAYVLNAITPVSAERTLYFWNLVRNFDIDNRSLTNENQRTIADVFAEDVEMLEAQQLAIRKTAGDVRLANLNIDAGSVRARRLLDKLIKADAAAG